MADGGPSRPQNGHEQIQASEAEEAEAVELVLFHVNEFYVYLVARVFVNQYLLGCPLLLTGVLKVFSKGVECIIRLEDKTSGELYAQAFLHEGEPHPLETLIDSSRYFVLHVEEAIGGRQRHAFIGIGFRERTEAYDFQAALHDHMKYLNKKKAAEEMEQHYQTTSSVDYSLKEGETLVLQIKNKGGQRAKSAFFEQGLNDLSLDDKTSSKEGPISLKPPPPPSAPVSPASSVPRSPIGSPQSTTSDAPIHLKCETACIYLPPISGSTVAVKIDDDFGDFQATT